ncbi:MAG: sugar phosphate isomerase/epimerase [Chloroflexi bacterium]|nr:sugar phosphate isomerase/epimerase [Chloroflexota bacterium]
MTIAIQLYSVRDDLKRDYEGTLRKIARMGYTHVEMASEYNGAPEKAAALLNQLGLKVCSAHEAPPVGKDKNRVLETLATLGTDTYVLPWKSPDHFQSLDGVRRVCDELNEADANARAVGMRVAYHNHHFECEAWKDGTLPLFKMLELLAPTVLLEVDVYWAQTGGVDAAQLVQQLGARAALLHMKDGPANTTDPMVALGEGVMNFPAIIQASASDLFIVELDRCATDMLEAVEKSYHYLKGVLHGR